MVGRVNVDYSGVGNLIIRSCGLLVFTFLFLLRVLYTSPVYYILIDNYLGMKEGKELN